METLNDFEYNILKRDKPREHKIKGSLGVHAAYNYYNKNKPKEKKYRMTDSQYYHIIRTINKELSDRLARGEDVKLPARMGKLELRKKTPTVKMVGNKVKACYPVDWKRTLELWYDDEDSYKNKTLLRKIEKQIFKVVYNKSSAKYNNKVFYSFHVNRELKNKLKTNIQEGTVDAFTFNYG